MTDVRPPSQPSPMRINRWVVLGAAVLGALIVWLPSKAPPVPVTGAAAVIAHAIAPARAAEVEVSIRAKPDAEKPAAGATADARPDARPDAKPDAKPEAKSEAKDAADAAGTKATPPAGDGDKRVIVVDKKGKHVTVLGLRSDAEYDSFSDLVNQEPWLGALIFFCVAMVFLVPLLLVLALIWYKLRKNRMQNETMLKLAEQGIVPPGEAIDAVSATPSAAAAGARNVLYERAKAARKATAWSDLRKGVFVGAIGAALVLEGIINDGAANGFGLILLFVGIGYGALWWFEDRRHAADLPAPPAETR